MVTFKRNTKYKILTPGGFKNFAGVRRTTKEKVLNITLTDGRNFKCSLDHRFIIDSKEVFARDVATGTHLNSNSEIRSVVEEEYTGFLYDPVEVEDGSEFISDSGIISHNCDFTTSGATVIEPEVLKWYEEFIQPPVEKRFIDHNYWIWEYPDYSKTYAIIVDVARGDGKDSSTIQVMDVEESKQVAEYKGQPDTRDLGRLAVSVATEYNQGLLIIENTGIGWDVVQTAIELQYPNLYYSPRSDAALTNVEMYLSRYDRGDGMVPGFSTNQRTRPLVVSKLTSYLHDKSFKIHSKRTHEELSTFVWKNGKAQAQEGYNDDLVIPLGIGLFLRDTALRFRQTGIDLTRASLGNITKTNHPIGIMAGGNVTPQAAWKMQNPYGDYEDLTWLLK